MMPDMVDFEIWLVGFMGFQLKAHELTGQPVPDEIQLLHYQAQQLEPLLANANQYAADATFYYYQAKSLAMKKLDFKQWAQSAIESMAKAESHKQLWARESSSRLVKTITSRIYSVKQALELMGKP